MSVTRTKRGKGRAVPRRRAAQAKASSGTQTATTATESVQASAGGTPSDARASADERGPILTNADKTRSVEPHTQAYSQNSKNRRHERNVDTEHFGSFLKQRREARGLSLADLSRATKIKEQSLQLLEEARLGDLPAPVFVRGFVSAYAREVGADQDDVLRRYREHVAACAPIVEEAPAATQGPATPLAVKSILDTLRGLDEGAQPGAAAAGGRRVGVVMVVLLILVVATLTLSLLLRHGGSAPPIS